MPSRLEMLPQYKQNTTSESEDTSNTEDGSVDAFSSAVLSDEMMTTENATLQERVFELERKTNEQEDELVCLRSSMADVLRRLEDLEAQPSVPLSNTGRAAVYQRLSATTNGGGLTPKNLSLSVSNLRKHVSALSLSDQKAKSTKSDQKTTREDQLSQLRTAPQNVRRPSELSTESPQLNGTSTPTHGQDSYNRSRHLYASPHRQGGRGRGPPPSSSRSLMSTSASSPMRKWVSSHEVTGGGHVNGGSFLSVPKSPVTPNANSLKDNRRFSSNMSLASAFSSRSLHTIGALREPQYFADQGMLQLFLRGRVVSLYAPSGVNEGFDIGVPNEAPKQRLRLDWVYGYRGRDCRCNLHMIPTGEMVYFTATVAILYNQEDSTQRHYTGHTDDIKCLAVHPNRLLIATGQSSKVGSTKTKPGAKAGSPGATCAQFSDELESVDEESDNLPHIRVWDSISLNTQQILGAGDFERAVSCVAFSKSDGGALLAAVDDSYDHTLSIWDWQRKRKITETKSANEQVFSCEFHPTERHLIVTCGKSHIHFWTFNGVTLERRAGVFDDRNRPKYVLCVCFTELGTVLSGDSNGAICVWNSKTGVIVKHVPKAHAGGVFSLCSVKGGLVLSGGSGKDSTILEWNADLTPTGRAAQLPLNGVGSIRVISQGKGNLILVGTTHNVILHVSMDLNSVAVLQGHSDELWGLCEHPIQQQFLTCGYDKQVKLWDSISHRLIWMKEIADAAHSCCFHPNGSVLTVGTTVGRWLVLDALTREVVVGQKDGNEIIGCIQYNMDGSMLAMGSNDGNIHLYLVSDEGRRYQKQGMCGVHSNFVTAIDWSLDCQYIRTNSADHELIFWHTTSCKPVAADCVASSGVRDLRWATQRCTVTFATAGIHDEDCYTGVNTVSACDVSHQSEGDSSDARLLVSANENGALRCFTYPSTKPKSRSHEATGHSCHVSNVRFLLNNSRVVSVGAKDSAIFQWCVQNAGGR